MVLNALWGPLTFQDAAMTTIAVPAALLHLAPVNHTSLLATLVSITAAVSMLVQPIGGAFSDATRRAGGRRRTIIIAGAVIDAICMLLLVLRPHRVRALAAALIVATVGYNLCAAGYQAMIPRLSRAKAGAPRRALRCAITLVGTVCGLAVAGATDSTTTFVVTASIAFLGALTLFAVPEGKWIEPEHAHVRDWHDFIVVFISRWDRIGLSLLMMFRALLFFSDVLKVGNPSAGTGLVAGCALLGAIVSSIWLGNLSDKVPRKIVVALAGLPMALAAFGFAAFPNERWILLFAALFGLGYGGVLSTGWALAIDAMPQLRDIARDLGLWGIAQNLLPWSPRSQAGRC